VIGATRHQDLAAAGAGAGDGDARRRRVAAILRKLDPVGMRHAVDDGFGELDHDLAGAVEQVALLALPPRRRLDLGMAVAEHDGTPAAHEIDVFVAIDVPDAAALAAGEELRIALRQVGGVLVPPHAARHDATSAFAQAGVAGIARTRHFALRRSDHRGAG